MDIIIIIQKVLIVTRKRKVVFVSDGLLGSVDKLTSRPCDLTPGRDISGKEDRKELSI